MKDCGVGTGLQEVDGTGATALENSCWGKNVGREAAKWIDDGKINTTGMLSSSHSSFFAV